MRRQEEDCRALAAQLGWDVAGLYRDNDTSAYNGKKRPAYEQLKADLKAGRIDALVVWHPDRLYRRVRDLLDVIDLVSETKAEVATVQAGAVDLTNANGRLVAKIGASVAEHESEHKAERVKRWHRQRAEHGKPNGGRRPFGFCVDRITHDPAEVAVIREAAERLLAGEKRFAIISDWNARGVPTATGVPWTTTSLEIMLRSPRIAGLRQHNGRTYPAVWEPILAKDEWERVKAALRSGAAKPGRPGVYVLSGILRCGLCGTGLVGNKLMSGKRTYRCPTVQQHGKGCGKVARNAEAVEGLITSAVFEALSSPALTDAITARAADHDAASALVATLATLEDRLARLKSEYAVEGLWSKADFLAQKRELETRISETASQASAHTGEHVLRGLPTVPGELAEWWEAADTHDRRAVISLVVDRILVHPAGRTGNKFDPSRIEICWRV